MGIALNWIAQGVMVAGAAAIGLWLMPAGRARARVLVWWTALFAVVCLPLVSLLPGSMMPAAPAMARLADAPLVAVPREIWTATSLTVSLWIAWIVAQSARFALDLRALAAVRRRCRPAGAPVESRLRPSTRARLAKSGARLTVCADVRSAAVLGFGPPIIAVQPALIDQLTSSELDQVVVHEWAHVARHDALGTLVQRLVHVVAGWHPAVRFATTRLHMEREMACDEVVVDAIGSAKAYAACLTRVASLAHTRRGSYLAVAMLSSPDLTRRVRRLLARRRTPAFAPQWMLAPAALAIAVALGSGQVNVVGVRVVPLVIGETLALALSQTPVVRDSAVATVVRPRSTPALPRATSVRRATVVPPPTIADPALAEPPKAGALDTPTAAELIVPPPVTARLDAPAAGEGDAPAPEPASSAAPNVTTDAGSAWAAATEAGESIGRGSRKGAVATAGFFTRLSKKVATSF